MSQFSISTQPIAAATCDVLALPIFKGLAGGPGVKEASAALGVDLLSVAAEAPLLGDATRKPAFAGDLGDAVVVQTLGRLPARAVLLVGMGERREVTASTVRKAAAIVARRAGAAKRVATTIAQAARGAEGAVRAAVEGFLLGAYRFERYKSQQNGHASRVESVALLGDKRWDARALKRVIEMGAIVAGATNLARDLTNTPSVDKSPESLAEEARRIAKETGAKVTVLDEKQLAAKGFGGILGVGRGSPKPPRLIELRWEPAGAKRTIAIVGKGITFDSGGINLKSSENLEWMKSDMGGAGAVLGAMEAICRLKPKHVAVRGYVATAENMPDGDALRPGDVIRHYGGTTVEIGNTDAEGRLVMADALVYARERGADVLLDVATLTGACVIALGNKIFGVMGEPRGEVRKVLEAAERAGEKAWELPLDPVYLSVMKSDIADLRNHRSKDVGAGATLAGLFLQQFVGDTPWVHIDIAGPSKSDTDDFENPKWATGVGVRTLVEYVLASR